MARGSVLSGLRRALTVRIASPHPACSLRGWSIPCPKAAQLPRGCLHLPPRPLPPHLPPLEVGRPLSPDPFVPPAAHQAGGAHSPGRGGNPFPGRGCPGVGQSFLRGADPATQPQARWAAGTDQAGFTIRAHPRTRLLSSCRFREAPVPRAPLLSAGRAWAPCPREAPIP